jgi:hypothetical protein
MKKFLSFLTLLVLFSVALPAFAADQKPPVGRVDDLSDLPSRASAWYSGQWQKYPVFTGIWTGLAVFAGLYCVSDSFKGRVRSLWTNAHKAVFGDTKCSSCSKPKPKGSQKSKNCPFSGKPVKEESAEDGAQAATK